MLLQSPNFSLKIKLLSLLAMLMVVYVHAYTFEEHSYLGVLYSEKSYNSFIQDFISQGVTRVAVPIFFIISGFLFFVNYSFNSATILSKYKKRVRSLLLPYLLWSGLGIVAFYIFQLLPQVRPFFGDHLIDTKSTAELLDIFLLNPIPYQLWFIKDLLVLTLISPLVWLMVKHLREAFLLVLFAAWLVDLQTFIFTPESVLYFSMGCYLSIKQKLLITTPHPKQTAITLFTWLGLILFKTELNYLSLSDELTSMLVHKAAIVAGIYAMWQFINYVTDHFTATCQKITNLTVSSFFIYAFHEPLLTILKKGLVYMFEIRTDFTTLLVYLLAPVLSILIAVLVAGLLRRNVPALFGMLTGYRDVNHATKPIPQQRPVPSLQEAA